jgi:nickel-type superoxide dismutase maturation protease
MSPTLSDSQVVLVNRFSYLFAKPELGDIVACRDPRDGRVLIKRITKIVCGRYFVSGDNKKNSTDSRKFGMIGKANVLGKVINLLL